MAGSERDGDDVVVALSEPAGDEFRDPLAESVGRHRRGGMQVVDGRIEKHRLAHAVTATAGNADVGQPDHAETWEDSSESEIGFDRRRRRGRPDLRTRA